MGNKSEISKKRVSQIDYMKAFGIYLVVLGHCIILSDSEGLSPVISWIYSFHMPLFFVVSGIGLGLKYDHNGIARTTNKEFIIKSLRQLVIPYLVWSFLYIVIQMIHNITDIPAAIHLLLERGYATVSFRGIAPLWFLAALFLGEIFFWISIRVLYNNNASIKIWGGY